MEFSAGHRNYRCAVPFNDTDLVHRIIETNLSPTGSITASADAKLDSARARYDGM